MICQPIDSCGYPVDAYKQAINNMSPAAGGLLVPNREDEYSKYWDSVACIIKDIDTNLCDIYANANPCTLTNIEYLERWAKLFNYPSDCGAELTPDNLCQWVKLYTSGCLGSNEVTYQLIFDITGLTDRGFTFEMVNPRDWRSCFGTTCERSSTCTPTFIVKNPDINEFNTYSWRAGSACCSSELICKFGRSTCVRYVEEIECLESNCYFPHGTNIKYELT